MDRMEAKNLTLAIIGCGNLGTAILCGMLASRANALLKTHSITRFLICVQSAAQIEHVQQRIQKHMSEKSAIVEYLVENNLQGASSADVIILTCPPHQAKAVLDLPEMRKSLSGKVLISMLGGVSVEQIENMLHHRLRTKEEECEPCYIVRAVTSVAAAVGKAVTVVEKLPTSMPLETVAMSKAILSKFGSVIEVRAEQMPAATALTASGIAFFSLMLEAAVDGAVALGIRHDQAVQMAAHTMEGMASLALAGNDCTSIRTQVITPGGSTARGIGVLEEGAVRGKVIRALRETASAHS